ncbi:flavodoxin family protein [Demequina sp. TTPB684]|uniref:flavodoxin family protein n=1 Tax=unclassified Demequina TaxID=2620311 RepID=UPI001CF4CC07|nr:MULTISPECIES: flavodoxin family protein [unclassified Demequina]MCB2412024.1 flavodoxin family protein [Demequina sp. TTPB684]UPU88809.1 flavodoxin family protein [Demequina sp. TMPB413]
MSALVVYESLWGNTAAIAHAIGEGIGEGTLVRHTGEVDPAEAAAATLLVAGAPVHAFSLPTESTKKSVAEKSLAPGDIPPDVSQPPLKTWLEGLPHSSAVAAAFDTRVRGPLGHGGASRIEKALAQRGYRIADKAQGFYIVNQKNVKAPASMLREGEIERAKDWGRFLASRA